MVERRLSSYELVRLIGEGGMARVYLARDMRLGREVAVKVLAEQLAQRQGFRDRFHQEARLAAALDHPNIVPIYDYGDEQALFLVMPFMSGGSLQQLVRQGPLDSARVATYGSQIADALAYAHERNVIHRDVKPANILLHADGRPMLSDFGLAKILSGAPAARRNRPDAGTPEYMAPEQIEGQSDSRVDIYGLGVVLYLLLTGRLPFTGATPGAVMEGHLTRLPERPRKLNRAVTPAIEGVVLRALSKHPDDRYQTATEMGAALLAAMVAGDAEPLSFLSDVGNSQTSLPPWLSRPSLPATHSLPTVAPLPSLPQTPAPTGADSVLAPEAKPSVGANPSTAPSATRVFPTVPGVPTVPPAAMPGVPGTFGAVPTPSPLDARNSQEGAPSSAPGSAPSLVIFPQVSVQSTVGSDERGWSAPIDRSAAQRAAAEYAMSGMSATRRADAGDSEDVANAANAAPEITAIPRTPSQGPRRTPGPVTRSVAPGFTSTLPPRTTTGAPAITGAPATTPPSASEHRPVAPADEGGRRLSPMLLALLALLIVAVGALVAWTVLHPMIFH